MSDLENWRRELAGRRERVTKHPDPQVRKFAQGVLNAIEDRHARGLPWEEWNGGHIVRVWPDGKKEIIPPEDRP